MFRVIGLLFLSFLSFSAVANSSATASWTVPTFRESGQDIPVEEIGGYRLAYNCGESKTVVINDGSATEFIFNDLPKGECSFSIAAFDSQGVMGADSAVVTVTIGDGPAPPINFSVEPASIPDTVQACMADPNCKVAVQGEWQ